MLKSTILELDIYIYTIVKIYKHKYIAVSYERFLSKEKMFNSSLNKGFPPLFFSENKIKRKPTLVGSNDTSLRYIQTPN